MMKSKINGLLLLLSSIIFANLLLHVNTQGIYDLPTQKFAPKHRYGDQVTTLLNKPFSPATYASLSSYAYQYYGEYAILDIELKEACRLSSKQCNDNSQCCSKFCRCTKWSTMGRETCWRKCL